MARQTRPFLAAAFVAMAMYSAAQLSKVAFIDGPTRVSPPIPQGLSRAQLLERLDQGAAELPLLVPEDAPLMAGEEPALARLAEGRSEITMTKRKGKRAVLTKHRKKMQRIRKYLSKR
mmetsp:Transcript_47374/g.135186  ORF Transcript_47374/g.135186 Transcript_47374/m.135186 type:complete len:118 (+) Transcript_47374:78-431(+)